LKLVAMGRSGSIVINVKLGLKRERGTLSKAPAKYGV